MSKYYIETGISSKNLNIYLRRRGWTGDDILKSDFCTTKQELEDLIKDYTKNQKIYIKEYEDREASVRIIDL